MRICGNISIRMMRKKKYNANIVQKFTKKNKNLTANMKVHLKSRHIQKFNRIKITQEKLEWMIAFDLHVA